MPDQFNSLVEAILDDDRARAKALLKQNATLATALATTAVCESRIPHWIYAGDSALHVAAAGYRIEIAKLLLEAGADCGSAHNHRNSQPLHYASDGYLGSATWDADRQVLMIELLLAAGADPTLKNKPGSTPFHLAVQNTGRGGSGADKAKAAQREIIEAFLDRGVSPMLKDGRGKAVLDWARSEWIRQMLVGSD